MVEEKRACPAALHIGSEAYSCDWPVDEDGKHIGWAHTNGEIHAVWTSDPKIDAIPDAGGECQD